MRRRRVEVLSFSFSYSSSSISDRSKAKKAKTFLFAHFPPASPPMLLTRVPAMAPTGVSSSSRRASGANAARTATAGRKTAEAAAATVMRRRQPTTPSACSTSFFSGSYSDQSRLDVAALSAASTSCSSSRRGTDKLEARAGHREQKLSSPPTVAILPASARLSLLLRRCLSSFQIGVSLVLAALFFLLRTSPLDTNRCVSHSFMRMRADQRRVQR